MADPTLDVQPVDLDSSWHDAFLAAIREMPNDLRACRAVGITRRTLIRHLDLDDEFAEDYRCAHLDGIDNQRLGIALIAHSKEKDVRPHEKIRAFELLAKLTDPAYNRSYADLTTGGKPIAPAPVINLNVKVDDKSPVQRMGAPFVLHEVAPDPSELAATSDESEAKPS